MNRILLGAVASAVTLFGLAQAAGAQVEISGRVYHVAVCPHGSNGPNEARCHAHIVTDKNGNPKAGRNSTGGSAGPYAPSDLQAAYNLGTAIANFSANNPNGATIAIVDAYGYNNAQSDMNHYRQQWGIPTCGTGCFTKVNQNGVQGSYPRQNSGWDEEQALDLDMVSAICPSCRILLVQASTASYANLATAVNTAARLGARAISNSYGGGESGSSGYNSSYNHPGIAVTASTGDSGYGVQFPASSPYVTAVGGTSLWGPGNETAWSGAGSGCSTVYAKPSWQADGGCTKRTVGDVSAVADPNTGVYVYYAGNWWEFGGTSVASPITASLYGLNGSGASCNAGTTSGACNAYSTVFANPTALHDVISGSNGSCGGSYLCTAMPGYDGPTGLGTPNGVSAY